MRADPRRETVAVGRLLWERGMVSGTEGNLSIRLGENEVLCTPAGVAKGFLAAKDLLRIDLAGRLLRGETGKPSSEIGMHLECYRRRPEIRAVCHAHPPHATAFASAGLGLTACVLPEIVLTLGAVPLAPYATPSTGEVAASVGPVIERAEACLLRNHGALTVGASLREAYHRMETIEHAARIVWLSRAVGGPIRLSPEEVEAIRRTRAALGVKGDRPECET